MKKSDCKDLSVKQLKQELRERKKNNKSIKLTVNKEELCKQYYSQHIEVDASVSFVQAMMMASPDMKVQELRHLKKKLNQLIDQEIAERKKPFFY